MKKLPAGILLVLIAGCVSSRLQPMAQSSERRFRELVSRPHVELGAKMQVSTFVLSDSKPIAILSVDGALAESEKICHELLTALRGADFSPDFSEINIKCVHIEIREGDLVIVDQNHLEYGRFKNAMTGRDEQIYYSLTIKAKDLMDGGSPLVVVKDGRFIETGKRTW